ncbi:MAG: hypothetical protein ACI4PR_02535 [Acutalibacteraceae bacterium]
MPARWTEQEEKFLKEIAPRYLKGTYEGYDWNGIATALNQEFRHDRTPGACEGRFYKMSGDNYNFIGH